MCLRARPLSRYGRSGVSGGLLAMRRVSLPGSVTEGLLPAYGSVRRRSPFPQRLSRVYAPRSSAFPVASPRCSRVGRWAGRAGGAGPFLGPPPRAFGCCRWRQRRSSLPPDRVPKLGSSGLRLPALALTGTLRFVLARPGTAFPVTLLHPPTPCNLGCGMSCRSFVW